MDLQKTSPKKDEANSAQDPPVIRYKSVNSKYRAQLAAEGSQLSNALKRVPPRVKALGGPIFEDFVSIATLCDKLEARVETLERELDEKKRSVDGLNERLEEGRTNFDLLVTRFTNSVEQATQLRKQVDEERHDTSQRHREALKQEKMLRDQVAALRRQVDGERLMASQYKKDHVAMKTQVADLERELAAFKTNNTTSRTPEPRSKRDAQQKEEIKRLNAEVASLKEDVELQSQARKAVESMTEKREEAAEKREKEYQDLLRKYEATSRILERSQDKLATANEFLEVNDGLASHDALARVIGFNEEIAHISSRLVERCSFLEDGEDDLPNPYANEPRADGNDQNGLISPLEENRDMVHRFLSPRFPLLLVHRDIEKRKVFLDLAIRACLVYFASVIINGGCFGLREDLDTFFMTVWGIVQNEHVQATAGRWRTITHHAIRASPQFPVNRTLVSSIIRSLGTILRMARCIRPEATAEEWVDDVTSLHANAVALEVDFKEKVVSTVYVAKIAAVDAPFLAVSMNDVSALMEGLRDEATHLKTGVKTVLACVSLGLNSSSGPPGKSRRSLNGKAKSDIRLEPVVLLDAVLPT
ncbi:hypothetical protein FRC19_002989 [Serendipita sp. 401]|nr:hypothetical protein FRC19_002989 [Serendipita sp. 401]